MTEADLLAAIDASPEEDAPRLAHADWLQSSDPARAEFIRLQVRLARAFPEEAEPEMSRAARLLEANRERWLAGLPRPGAMEWGFVRGYPEEVIFTSRVLFEKSWRQLLLPGVRRVRFRDVANLGRIAASPGLARARELVIHNLFLPDEVLLEVVASPHLGGLRGLHVVCGRPTAASLVAIARLPALEQLRFKSSIPQPLAAEGVRALAGLSGLRSLTLTGWRLADEAARALWAGRFPALAFLDLRGCAIGPGGLEGLGDGACMPALERLDLGQNSLGDAGTEVIARATRWTALRWLSLLRNVIGAPGAAALAGAAHLARLESLNLHWNAIPDGGAEAFARSRPPGLRRLDLSYNLIGDAGMRALAGAGIAELRCAGNPAAPALIEAAETGKAPPPEAVPRPIPAAQAGKVVGPADEDALVRAILADPWDELARAAYADWLEEQGKPLHAELQRLPWSEEARRQELVEEVGRPAFKAFASSVASYPHLWEDGLLTVRMGMQGFVAKYFQARAAACLREHHIERIELEGKLKDWTRLAAAVASAELRALGLGGTDLRDDGARVLAGCDGMGRLCALSLRGARLGLPGVAALCGSARLVRLVALDLPDSGLDTDSVRALADGPLAGRLRRLDLRGGRLGDVDLGVLLNSRTFASALVSLDLALCELSDRSAGALAACEHLGALRSLDVSNNRFTEAGLALLAGSGLLRRLHWLRARVVYRGALDGHAALARAAADVPGLVLVLNSELPEDGVAAFREMLGERLLLE
jgi:uncharacterized protein (TIGR02996 family)